MNRNFGLCLILLLTTVCCLPCTSEANPAPQPISGGAVSAKLPHETIRMDAEEVTIRLGKGSYTVEGLYHMVNTGEETTEWVGFPKNRDKMHEDMSYHNFIHFHAWIDGKKLPLVEEGRQWLAGQVTFPGHATTVIRCLYEMKYPATYKWRSDDDYAEYIVGTGSLWKGTIRKAIFTVDGSGIGGTRKFDTELMAPESHKLRSEHLVRFDVKDFKPEPDATLYVHIGGFNSRRKASAR